MAIDMLKVEAPAADHPGICARYLEAIARGTVLGSGQTAGAIADAAVALLRCDAAVVLRASGMPDVLHATVAREYADASHDGWQLGSEASQILERPCDGSERTEGPWARLRTQLWDLGIRSWTGVPLRSEGRSGSLGLLIAGSRGDGPSAGRMDRLQDLKISATTALSAAAECGACPPGGDDLRTVGALAFGIAHSLGNVFGAIMGNLHFLEEQLAEDVSTDLIEPIRRSTARGTELMRSLQRLSGDQEGAVLERVDLAGIAGDVADLAAGLCGHWPSYRGVRIETQSTGTTRVRCDPTRLREALVNIVFNAVRAVASDGTISVRTTGDADGCEVRVIDDGPGMTAGAARRATEPFFSTEPQCHQGLGLTVARGAAVAYGGSLTLHEGAEGGTEVALRMPKNPPVERRPVTRTSGSAALSAGTRKELAR